MPINEILRSVSFFSAKTKLLKMDFAFSFFITATYLVVAFVFIRIFILLRTLWTNLIPILNVWGLNSFEKFFFQRIFHRYSILARLCRR